VSAVACQKTFQLERSSHTKLFPNRTLRIKQSYARLTVGGAAGAGAGIFAIKDAGGALYHTSAMNLEKELGGLMEGLDRRRTVVGMALVLATSEVGLLSR
jgi:hypothetical protein